MYETVWEKFLHLAVVLRGAVPHNVGGRRVEGVRRRRECPGARFVKEGVIAVQNIGHQNRASLQSARSIEILLIPGFLSGFTGASSYP